MSRRINGRGSECIDYTELGENDYFMILNGICYLVILFCRVILYVWCSPRVFSL